MKTTAPVVVAAALAVVSLELACAANTSRVDTGRPVDSTALARVTPNTTTFSEVLTLLGPPDYVIDGTRRLIDEEAFFANLSRAKYDFKTSTISETPVTTRVLTAPEGEFILIFPATVVAGRVLDVGTISSESATGRSGDLLVFVSKKDRTVLRLVRSQPEKVDR